ncbi:MAG TPA: ice-binding family protein [Polyangiaceae bacterium]|nr:ice-binding family protein [Polyangiaceae bacterium]
MLFVRRLLLTAVPTLVLLAGACSDNDTIDPEAGGAGGLAGTAGRAGAAGNAGQGAAGKAGATGSAGEAGSSGSDGSSENAGSSGANAEAGAAGALETGDRIAPTVFAVSPLDGSTESGVASTIRVTFSEQMDASTLTAQSFQVTLAGVAVPGQISYFQRTATFTPNSPLVLNSSYHGTVSVAAKDLAGNALAQAYAWNFKTSALAALGPAPVKLGMAGNYAILAMSAISNVPTSAVTGNLGLSPMAASYITGFALTKAGTHWTSPQVVGGVFAADNDPPTPSLLTTAVANMLTAYTDAAGRSLPDFVNLGAGTISGVTLVPGLYNWASSLTIPGDVALAGAANDVWIFQITGDLKLSAAKAMTLSGGARAQNVFWQVAGAVDLGTTSHSEGIVLCKTAITLGTGASINGRLLAQTAVSIASSTVTEPTL